MDYKKLNAIIYAVLAALFYAINIPCSKVLLNNVSPTFMAAFLYLGAGFGVGIMYIFHTKKESREERLGKLDIPYTLAMVVLDIIAPILLMIGVKLGTAANASLLGNFEIVATTLIAYGLFRERVSARMWGSISLITVASIVLSISGEGSFSFSLGSIFVIGATVCWGLENNCTRKISGKSTYEIVTIKGIGSGTGSFIVAMVLGESIPGFSYIALIMMLGFVAYGLSIFTYIRAQKTLGAAKTSAYYAIAPFIGVALSSVFLKERFTLMFIIALIIMIAGTVLIVRDTLIHSHKHAHTHLIIHTHDGTTHTHTIVHSHDHVHVINEGKHGHTHSVEELENDLGHGGTS
ncbi:MAG: DMT family transporter [Butyrivibrio sp.]|uniref:DMT family transporter n=1 Tax=Butyrivibrio sp. TaxID=28121 RepID=UPI0025D023D2|nr:DMT family transporter [Butyrivibrio sp.]MCR5771209.1 DMT family transporter [Butyrivibrio sp.]